MRSSTQPGYGLPGPARQAEEIAPTCSRGFRPHPVNGELRNRLGRCSANTQWRPLCLKDNSARPGDSPRWTGTVSARLRARVAAACRPRSDRSLRIGSLLPRLVAKAGNRPVIRDTPHSREISFRAGTISALGGYRSNRPRFAPIGRQLLRRDPLDRAFSFAAFQRFEVGELENAGRIMERTLTARRDDRSGKHRLSPPRNMARDKNFR